MVEPFSVQKMRFISSRKRNMPSKNTSVISARVKDETALKLTQIAENRGITVSRLLDEIAEKIDEETLFEKGVTPDGYAVSEDSDELYRYKELGFDRVKECFENHKYPDREIRKQNEFIAEQISRQGNFNSKRSGEDWA